jgi:hypothetical protein
MAVFRDQLFFGFRNPRGTQIVVSKDGQEFKTVVHGGFKTRQNIDIPVLFPYSNTLLFAGVKNADIMTGRTSGARIYVSTNGIEWEMCYQFKDLGTEVATISSFIPLPGEGEILAGGRGLLSGKLDQGMLFKGTIGTGGVKFGKSGFGYTKFPGITCMVSMGDKIVAGCSSPHLLSIDPTGAVYNVELPGEVIEFNGFVSALYFKSPRLYMGITYPTFPVKGASVYSTEILQERILRQPSENRVVKSSGEKVQFTSSGKTLLAFGGIVVILLVVFFIIQRMSKR